MHSKNLRGSLLCLLAAAIWGAAFVAQSVGMDYVGPFTFNFTRMLLGSAVLVPVILWRDGRSPAHRKAHGLPELGSRRTLVVGGVCYGVMLFIGSTLQQIGIQYTTAGKAGFITALYVVLVPIAGLAFGRRPRWWVWLGVALSAVGLWLLCMTGPMGLNPGDGLVMLCAVGFTFHILVVDHFSPLVDGVKLSCIQFFTCGMLNFIPMLLTEQVSLTALMGAAAPILYAGILSCGVAYTLQVVAQKDTDPTLASLILCLESVFAVIFGALLLKESLSTRELLGCGLMFAAILLAQKPDDD